ncbi:MAG: hypothetical protein V2I97_11655 [Desulfococcaceae bacterium]|jgi:hypothetical protein|nr:hypothetical protein [Desulfococcaceae bacterium]
MTGTVARMSQEEFRLMIESVVKRTIQQELRALLKDPDSDSEIRDDIMILLTRQAELTAKGERGRSFDDVMSELGLE